MTRYLSLLIYWGCSALLVLLPMAAVFYLVDIQSFAELARNNIGLPIEWNTVTNGQWYFLWLVTLLYVAVGFFSLFFLRRAFSNFADGQLFNLPSSKDLKRFSVLLLVQAFAKPVHLAISSLLLSINHPPGQKMLSISFGSNEVTSIALGMVCWVVSDLLIEGTKLQTENRQFI